MTDNITLPRAVVEMVRDSLDYARRFNGASVSAEIAALDAALEAQEDEALLNEPVAMRYDGDGYGYLYIDSGSGSDWQRRHKDAEPLYLAPPKPDAKPEPATDEQVTEADAKSIEADAKRYADSLTIAEYAAALAEAGWSAESIADALRARGSK
jgi:hypothetical protein